MFEVRRELSRFGNTNFLGVGEENKKLCPYVILDEWHSHISHYNAMNMKDIFVIVI
jgi:hypothetical protein